jgi:radical SAM protein
LTSSWIYLQYVMRFEFDSAPFLVIWEVTRACDLTCLHCRASALARRNPLELTTTQGKSLLSEIRRFGDPLMVFTGGDPLKRPDLFQLLRFSVGLGLRTTVTPSATPLLTEQAVCRIAESGVARMAISLDDSSAERHDEFRGVEGSFERSIMALSWAHAVGLETQINTTVTRRNWTRLDEVADLVSASGAKLWSVFFLVPTGRASLADDLSAEEYEKVFERLYSRSKPAAFDIKTTEAQHYRRFVAQQRKREGSSARSLDRLARIARRSGVNDGKGLVFISHTGEIYPSGFLPLSAGNVRERSLLNVYRDSPLFRALRLPDEFSGQCGVCEFRNLCGGSRSRAYALTGDPLASDPRCVYVPPAYRAVSQGVVA